MYMTSTALAKFIPRHFVMLCNAIINEIVSLISFTDCSVPIFRSTLNF